MANNDSNDPRPVVIVDVQIPFGSMVTLLVKWALAIIPALIILLLFAVALTMVLPLLGIRPG